MTMRHRIIASLTLVLILSLPAAAQDLEVIRNVRLRAGPSSAYQRLLTLHEGDRLFREDVSQEEDYVAVRTEAQLAGWVYAPFVRSISAEPESTGHPPDLTGAGDGTLGLHFIDVGQGDSTLIVCPNGRRILVDAGSTSGASAEDLRDYLIDQTSGDDPWVDTLVITHPDADHYNLLVDALEGFSIGHVYHVGAFKEYNKAFRTWLQAIPAVQRTKLSSTFFDEPSHPDSEMDCGAAAIYVLAANVQSSFSAKNTRSIVMMLRFGEFEAILTGDATKDTEKAILQRYPEDWLRAELLKLGHHGSSYTSTTKPWADAVRPEVAIASAAWHSEHGHPREAVYQIIDDYTVPWEPHLFSSSTGSKPDYDWDPRQISEAVFSTATNGTIVVTTSGVGDYAVEWFDYGS